MKTLSLIALGVALAGLSPVPTLAQTSSPPTTSSPVKETGSGDQPPAEPLSAGLQDVVKLTQAGVDENVILSFVRSSTVAYHPSAEEIIRLEELGVSEEVLTALLRRGDELRSREPKKAPVEQRIIGPLPGTPPGPSAVYSRPANIPTMVTTYPTAVTTYPTYDVTYLGAGYYPPAYGYYSYAGSPRWSWPYYGGFYSYPRFYGHAPYYRHFGHYPHYGFGYQGWSQPGFSFGFRFGSPGHFRGGRLGGHFDAGFRHR